MSVRKFREEDTDIVAAIADLAWQEVYQGYCDQIGEENLLRVTGDYKTIKGIQMRQIAAEYPNRLLVHEEESGQITGFIYFHLDPEKKIGTIGNNAVDPLFRGKGIAQKMYAEVLKIFREEGMKLARVSTGLDEAHAPARKAYERAGFDICGMPSVNYFRKLD